MINENKQNMYFNSNPKLKAANVAIDYTDEQIKEIVKCMDDFVYFCVNYIKIVDHDSGKIIPFDLYDYQKEMANIYKNEKRVIILAPRQCGKSIFTIAYLLWVGTFNDYKNIILVANKESTAKKTLRKLKEMYLHLPFWMKQGLTEWNKKQISFENGTNIYAESTSSSGNRGDTASIVFLDEAAIIEKNLWDEFYTSVYPTIASVKSAQIIISSTPKGYNHFYQLWSMALNGQSEYKPMRVKWNEVPGRDEAYKIKTIAAFGGGSKGIRKWRQEFECFFAGSGGTLIDGEILEDLVPSIIVESRMDNKFTIYEYPEDDAQYCSISDVSEGVGGDFSTCQIFKIDFVNGHKQVASFKDNTIKTNEFDAVIDQIAKYYNNALAIVEANTYGREVLNKLVYDDEYSNVFYEFDSKDYGLKMTVTTKRIGNSYLKSNIEDKKIILTDFDTISELSKYVLRGNVYRADDGQHDDLVTPLVLFSYFLSKKELIENWLTVDSNVNKTKMMQQIEADLLPVGFISNGHEEINLQNVVNTDNDFEEDF
jgi:hypothetical protein